VRTPKSGAMQHKGIKADVWLAAYTTADSLPARVWAAYTAQLMTPYIAAERATLNTEGVSDQGEVHRFRAVRSCLVASGWRWRR
jgi:hypothetical protein